MSGISCADFRTYIVAPTTDLCARLASVPDTPFIRDLLVATAAQESMFGVHLHQTGRGDAISVYQFEPSTLDDLMRNFISPLPRFNSLLAASLLPGQDPHDQIMWNLRFATVAARLNYYRVKEPLPALTNFSTLWHYYKTYWNTALGAATEGSFEDALKLTDIRL